MITHIKDNEYKISLDERFKNENEFCKFDDFVHTNEAFTQKIKLATYYILF